MLESKSKSLKICRDYMIERDREQDKGEIHGENKHYKKKNNESTFPKG